MMVGYRHDGRVTCAQFSQLPELLVPGDLVVVNTSATLPAAVTAHEPDSRAEVVVHFSTYLGDDEAGTEEWVVEPRLAVGNASKPWPAGSSDLARPGRPFPGRLTLGAEAWLDLFAPYRQSRRLWQARLHVPRRGQDWLADHGRPVRYDYVPRPWPLSAYQNVYANEPGSAEMPSAGRPFTTEMITRLVASGVAVAPVVLHTGVASLEADEAPYPERVRVLPSTAHQVAVAKATGGRVIAVGTSVVRALESAYSWSKGRVEPLEGWTDLVVGPERPPLVVDGLLTGWHEPAASHLWMLEAIAGRPLLEDLYDAGLRSGYLWHEFGDVALVLP
jgi:S-adenosylmethionine:tRNA ribosyltransferase-isomerase